MAIKNNMWFFLRNQLHILHFSKIPFISYLLYGYKVYNVNYIKDFSCRLIYNRNTYIGNEFFNGRIFEKSEISFLTEKLQKAKNPVFIDIGANIGLHTIYLCKNCPSLKTISFEPSPNTFKVLSANIKWNGLTNSTLLNLALSDKSAVADFYETADDAFNSLKDTGRKTVKEITQVKVSRFDDINEINNLPNITLIKIDVEGFENEVLDGAVTVINKFKPDLFVEIYKGENSNLNPDHTIQKIISLGYNAFVFNSEGTLLPFVSHDDAFANYYFTFKNN